jgi:hypothetical protein
MDWNIVVAVVAVVFTVVLWVLYRPHHKHSTPEQKLNFNRIIFITAIITIAVGMWWTSTH